MGKRLNTPYRIYKRGDVYWAYITVADLQTNKNIRFRCSTGKISIKEAEQFCLQKISEIQSTAKDRAIGQLPSITVDAAFTRYFEEKAQYHTRPHAILLRLKQISSALGVTYFHQIDKACLSAYVAKRRETVKNATINRELAIISAVKNLADEFWEVRTSNANPLKFKLPTPAENIKYLADWNIANKIIDRAAPHLKPIIYTALYTGFRRGDILGLMWENIDFATSTITIKVKDSTKAGGKRIHTIPIIPQLERILQAQPKINKYVFNYNGKPIADIKHAWHSIFYDHNGKLRDPALPYTNFHTLRHTAVTWILKATGDIRLAQKIVGHKDIKTTARYAHVLDEDKRTGLIKTFGLDDVHNMYTLD